MISKEELADDKPGISRRKFIYNTGAVAVAGAVLSSPLVGGAASFLKTEETHTVKQIMDLFIKQVPGGVLTNTVDTLKSGSPDTKVSGIITTMFATVAVIRQAISLGANFIIAHEPTFYNHTDNTQWLETSDVYQYKANLLKQHNIAVWRNHDYIHRLVPDGVTMGVLAQLEWQPYTDHALPNILTLPAAPLKDIIGHVKTKLHIKKVRYIGDPGQPCSRVLFMPGAPGGQRQIEAIMKVKPDLLLCGEIQEWETAEYVRDARAKGDKVALAVVGHIASEEAGSEFMLNWLKMNVPEIKATHVNCRNSLSFI